MARHGRVPVMPCSDSKWPHATHRVSRSCVFDFCGVWTAMLSDLYKEDVAPHAVVTARVRVTKMRDGRL